MLLAYADMVHAPVAAADIGEKVGSVVDLVVDAPEHVVVAFLIKPSGLFAKPMFVSPHDVIEYDTHALILASANTVVPTDEIVRAHTILQNRDRVLRRAVITEAGHKIGRVVNFAIDTETAGIVRYYVGGMLGRERIIPTTSVIAVQPHALVIRENEGLKRIASQKMSRVNRSVEEPSL